MLAAPIARPDRRRSSTALRLSLAVPLIVTLPVTSIVLALATKVPVPASVGCGAVPLVESMTLRGSSADTTARKPKESASCTETPETTACAPLVTAIDCESSVTPRWNASVVLSVNRIWSSAVRRSLSNPLLASLSAETSTAFTPATGATAAPL